MKRTKTFRRGLLTGIAAIAIMGGVFLACSDDPEERDTEATGISIAPQEATLYVEDDADHPKSTDLTATIEPANTTNKNVTWLLEGSDVVTLSATTGGTITVTANQPGSAKITARTANNISSTVVIITVHQNASSGQAFEVAEGSYSAGDTNITISKDGTVTIGESSGSATVTKNEDGSTTLTVTIDGTEQKIVIAADGSMTYNGTPLVKEATDITIAPQEAALYVDGSDDDYPKARELTATVVPADAANKTVTWSAEENDVVTLSATTGEKITVTAKKSGSATVTATTANGISKTITVTVSAQAFEKVCGSYTAGSTNIIIKQDGTVTIGSGSGPATVTINDDGLTTLTVTIDGTDHTIVIAANGTMTYNSTTLEKAKPILVANGTETKYDTIQSALNAVTGSGDYTIKLPKGTYNENYLHYTGAATIKISGDTTEQYGTDVVITGHGENMKAERSRELLEFQGTGNLILENISFVSDYSRADHSGDVQAEVVGFDSTGYLAAYNCAFKSHQDTLRTTGKAWFYKCYVEGDVDFIWMESSGIVALYEECEIVSVYDENATTHETKICAPRMSPTSKVGKGVVIYNSNVREDENGGLQKTYLARTPWKPSDGYWNQVAYIKTKLSGIEADPWYKTPCTADGIPQTVIGWKLCGESAASCGYAGSSDIVSSEDVAKEFSGRKAILNRLYDTSAGKYKKDSETNWDIDALIAKTGWNVTADTSKDLLDGETETVTVTYDLSSETLPSELTITGFSHHSSGSVSGGNGSTITVPLTGKAVVIVTGIYSGNGTIKAGSQGDAVYDFGTGSTSKTAEKGYVVYDASATSVVITATSSTYITKIEVEYDNTLTFTPVTEIAVSGDSTTYTVGVPLNLSATVTPGSATNRDVKWSSSDDAVGTIDADKGIVTFVNAGNVTFTATARDGSEVTGTITCTAEAATWTSAEWYISKDSSTTTTSGKGIGCSATDFAGKNNNVFTSGSTSGVSLGAIKTVTSIDSESLQISTGLKMDGSGNLTFSVTKNATVLVKTGYCSDSNVTSGALKITASNGGTATADSANLEGTPTADADYKWTLKAGTYKIERVSGYAPSVYYVRVDITE